MAVAGPVDVVASRQLSDVLLEASHAGATKVVVDLGAVTLLGSAAISVLVQPWLHSAVLCAPLGSSAQHVLTLVGTHHATRID